MEKDIFTVTYPHLGWNVKIEIDLDFPAPNILRVDDDNRETISVDEVIDHCLLYAIDDGDRAKKYNGDKTKAFVGMMGMIALDMAMLGCKTIDGLIRGAEEIDGLPPMDGTFGIRFVHIDSIDPERLENDFIISKRTPD